MHITKEAIARVGIDFDENYYEKYRLEKEVHYKYRGQDKVRIEFYDTEECKAIRNLLGIKAFTCPVCKRMVCYGGLAYWRHDDFDALVNDEIECSMCYEDEMGDDL